MTGLESLSAAHAVAGPAVASVDPVVLSVWGVVADFFEPSNLVSVLVDGLAKSAIYVMIAAGLTLIFGLMGVLNFAHGSLTMVGAYVGGLVMILIATGTSGWTTVALFFVAAAIVLGVLAAIGGAIEMKLVRPLYDRPPIYQLLLTFGLTLVIEELARIVVKFYGIQPITSWAAARGTKPWLLANTHEFGPVSVQGLELFEIFVGAVTVVAVWAFLTKTRYGLYVRAGTEDEEMAAALGIDVRRVFTTVFALGVGIAGVAGLLLMWDKNWGASVHLATETLLPAFVVVIIGGLGTFRGTVYAAVIVGMADAVTSWLFVNAVDFTSLPELTIFLILVAVLVVKPQGLFGAAEVGGH